MRCSYVNFQLVKFAVQTERAPLKGKSHLLGALGKRQVGQLPPPAPLPGSGVPVAINICNYIEIWWKYM